MLCHSVPELYQSRASCRLRSPALSPSVPICVCVMCVMGVYITCVCVCVHVCVCVWVCVLSMSAFCIVCHVHGLLVHAKFLPLPLPPPLPPSTTCSSGLQHKSFISITMIKRIFALKPEVTPKGTCRNELGKPESPTQIRRVV